MQQTDQNKSDALEVFPQRTCLTNYVHSGTGNMPRRLCSRLSKLPSGAPNRCNTYLVFTVMLHTYPQIELPSPCCPVCAACWRCVLANGFIGLWPPLRTALQNKANQLKWSIFLCYRDVVYIAKMELTSRCHPVGAACWNCVPEEGH